MDLPRDYIDYIARGGVLEAFLTCEFPGYMVLAPLQEIAKWNEDYQVHQYAPGFLCFGSNGGGELLVFDEAGAIYCLPAIGMEPAVATRVANSWTEFERHIESPR